MAVLLALVAAGAYGLSDFVGGVTSQRAPAWSVALMAQVGGSTAVLVLALLVGGEPTRSDLAWAVLAGVGNGAGTAFLYRGLSSGRMGVIAPVSGVGAVVLPVAVGLLLGERPGPVVWLGLLLALPAIGVVSREPDSGAVRVDGAPPASRAVLDGVLAGAGFGTLFVALSRVGADAGLFPLALNQVVAAGVVVAMGVATRAAWVPRQRAALAGIACGLLGASATGLFMVSTRYGYLAVTAVITSLYPAFTVVLAAVVLREHIHRAQAFGLLLCAVSVGLVALG